MAIVSGSGGVTKTSNKNTIANIAKKMGATNVGSTSKSTSSSSSSAKTNTSNLASTGSVYSGSGNGAKSNVSTTTAKINNVGTNNSNTSSVYSGSGNGTKSNVAKVNTTINNVGTDKANTSSVYSGNNYNSLANKLTTGATSNPGTVITGGTGGTGGTGKTVDDIKQEVADKGLGLTPTNELKNKATDENGVDLALTYVVPEGAGYQRIYGDSGNNGDDGNNGAKDENKITYEDVQDTSEVDWLTDYYNTLMARYNEMVAKQKEANDLYYNKQSNDINSRYGRLLRRLSKRAVDNGQDQYVTNAWNINYAKDLAQNDLAIERAKAEATDAENNYNNYNAIYTALANSNASDAVKKKFYNNPFIY